MDINLKITLPTQDELTDYCKALGWTQDNELSEKEYFNEEIASHIRKVVKNYRVQEVLDRQVAERNASLRAIEEANKAEVETVKSIQDSLPIILE